MNHTRHTILARASSGSDTAWSELVELYQPLVYGWLRNHDVAHHDAEELTQDVLQVVVKELPSFSHSGRVGAFRNWLRQITANRARGFWRSGKIRPTPSGSSTFLELIDQLEDETSDLSRNWAREHDGHVLRQLLAKVEHSFEAMTLVAFRRQVFDGLPAEHVASELGLTVTATYSAKARVLRTLRAEAAGLVDEFYL